jgi:Amt family ammonium transporter
VYLFLLCTQVFQWLKWGFTQSKNAVNIIMKNFVTVAIGVTVYFLIGFAFMYGTDAGGVIGTDLFMLINRLESMGGVMFELFFFFQAIFAATCVTIVSGAVAERTKFNAYVIFCVFAVVFIYPIIGHWIWGGGFLQTLGFKDFAGGTAVHAIGGLLCSDYNRNSVWCINSFLCRIY